MGTESLEKGEADPPPPKSGAEVVLPSSRQASLGGSRESTSVFWDADDGAELAHSIPIHPTWPRTDRHLDANHSQKWECQGSPKNQGHEQADPFQLDWKTVILHWTQTGISDGSRGRSELTLI